jgi:hypothetical protein
MTPPEPPPLPPARQDAAPSWYPRWLSLTLLALCSGAWIYLLVRNERAPEGAHDRVLSWLLVAAIVFPLLGESGYVLRWWRRRRSR